MRVVRSRRSTLRRIRRALSLLPGHLRLGGFATGCVRGNCTIRRTGGLRRVRCSGLGEADAGLITVSELDTGSFERAADRKFISNGEGSP
jgi:hypothetical protein